MKIDNYTKILLIIAGLILIPAIFISKNFTSAYTGMISTSPGATTNQLPSAVITNDTQDQIFLFMNISDFPVLDSWAKIFPEINIDVEPDIDIDEPPDIPPVTDDEPKPIATASLWETWQEIKDQPIGVDIDDEKQKQIFETRKKVFDNWFETTWQEQETQAADCQQWWCITPPTWVKTTAYNLWKFDFSQDWAWDQFAKDHPEAKGI